MQLPVNPYGFRVNPDALRHDVLQRHPGQPNDGSRRGARRVRWALTTIIEDLNTRLSINLDTSAIVAGSYRGRRRVLWSSDQADVQLGSVTVSAQLISTLGTRRVRYTVQGQPVTDAELRRAFAGQA